MDELFKGKFNIDSNRKDWWDYGQGGLYFITICTHNRTPFFGEVHHGTLKPNKLGKIALECWNQISTHFPHAVPFDFIAMPDHIHGLLGVKPELKNESETQNFASLIDYIPKKAKRIIRAKNQFGPQSRNLGSIIRGYKIGVAKEAKRIDEQFKWQSNYFDFIVLRHSQIPAIKKYIRNNALINHIRTRQNNFQGPKSK